jgi:hypothetical protein
MVLRTTELQVRRMRKSQSIPPLINQTKLNTAIVTPSSRRRTIDCQRSVFIEFFGITFKKGDFVPPRVPTFPADR